MELAAIHKARAMAFIEPADLNPHGKVYYPVLVKALVARYSFQSFPQKLEEFDEAKGIKFGMGHLGDAIVDEFVIYTHGLLLSTRTSTHDSKKVLEDALAWGVTALGLANRTIPRWQFASELTF